MDIIITIIIIIIIDFRRKTTPITPLLINDQAVEMVESFKFLGTTISSSLKWETNTNTIIGKCHQRMYFLRQLRKFRMSAEIMTQFYRAVIESILTFSLTVWYSSTTQEERDRLEGVVRTASRIIGDDLPSVESIFHKRARRKALKIQSDPSHPACYLFERLPSGRRLRSIKTRTRRFASSFFPSAVQLVTADCGR